MSKFLLGWSLGLLLLAGAASAGDRERTAALAAEAAREVAVADSLATVGQDARLIARAQGWLDAHPDAPDLTWPLRQRLGLALHRSGRNEDAIMELERTVLWAPGRPENHRNLALALLAAGKRGRAFGEYREAMDLAPGDDEIRAEYAHVLLDFGQTDQAAAVLAGRRGGADPSPALDRAEARLHLQRNAPAAARAALERLHAADPEDSAVAEQLALARLRDEDPEGARLLLVARWPGNLGETGRRVVLEADRRLGDAVRARGIALALGDDAAPGDPDLLALASLICYEQGEAGAGLALIDRAILLRPDSAAYRNNRVALLLKLDRREEADAEWVRVLELDPTLADNRREETRSP